MFLLIDEANRPVVIIVFAHVVLPYVRPHFSKYSKTKQISNENNVQYWQDCGSGRVDHWWHLSCFSLFLWWTYERTYGHIIAWKQWWPIRLGPGGSTKIVVRVCLFVLSVPKKRVTPDHISADHKLSDRPAIVDAFWRKKSR